MIKLEDELVSLELAKEMKELGFKQDSLWYWATANSVNYWINRGATGICDIPAYTVAELGEILPYKLDYDCWLEIDKIKNDKILWCVSYRVPECSASEISFKNAKEADARAKMLIYLKKQGWLL